MSALVREGLGIGTPPPDANPASLPAAEQTALGKCDKIVGDFTSTVDDGPLAGIQTLGTDIYNDLKRNTAVANARKGWSACMARNGYSYPDPQTAFRDEMRSIFGGGGRKMNIGGTPVSAARNQAQIAMAVTDANCTQSTDLAGIYFAVQASYEQQIVDANQQALTTAVRQFRGRLPEGGEQAAGAAEDGEGHAVPQAGAGDRGTKAAG